ncbi:acyl-CoA synthetase (AMP-forming)/AMP-acid ligase II [Pseudonocardia hierapolitana]|uniref:Acyl-CoA synthetase (AMP-forming)/AMP-acid ligase II n=1 Tax=Pseudonocardia hierapolitana TaxID=1128676 RepID=A0A561SLF0_9PSEU|nr:AMP-binding protein [Pseudonocardia hierapolitana]TWF75695.1 acyl-CoA synthetase (AMP-forming)/AMP-acid ligase II [Pseudonocardia hierapolitana]
MIITSAFGDVGIPDVTLPEYVLAHAPERGAKPAIVDGASGRVLTYADLASGVRRCAAGLAACGLRPRDVFAIMMPNLPEYAGGVVTTLSPLATADEAAYQLADTSARFLLTVPPCLQTALAAADKAGVERVFVLGAAAPGASAFSELFGYGDTPPAVRVDPSRDLAALLCSSGTTGWPKGVMLTHRALVAALVELDRLAPFGEQERPICPIPFFHVAGQSAGMNKVLRAGATVVTMSRFDVESFLALIQQHRVTAVLGAPPIVLALAKHPLVDRYDLSSLEKVVSGSAPLSAQVQAACAERLGRFVGQAYGLTETGLIVSASPHDGRPARPGSAGMLVPNTEARLVDPATGTDVPAGEAGELWVRGPQLMSGYLGNPEATADVLDDDGWLHTGDLVRIDPDGWLFVVDRVKELIKYKGHQVAPAQLEALLGAHPAVADCAVVGRPDEAAGEIPVAYVVRRRDVEAVELIEHVAGRVSPPRRVRAVVFVDEIPRSPAGKILRRVLADHERS